MSKSLPLMIRHAMYSLRGGFLIRPLTIALTLGCAGAFLSWLEEMFPAASAWVPTVLFPSHADPQVAQVILAGAGASSEAGGPAPLGWRFASVRGGGPPRQDDLGDLRVAASMMTVVSIVFAILLMTLT